MQMATDDHPERRGGPTPQRCPYVRSWLAPAFNEDDIDGGWNANKCIAALQDPASPVSLVLGDSALLDYIVAQSECSLELAGDLFYLQGYSFMAQQQSLFTERLSTITLQLREEGTVEKLAEAYFPENACDQDGGSADNEEAKISLLQCAIIHPPMTPRASPHPVAPAGCRPSSSSPSLSVRHAQLAPPPRASPSPAPDGLASLLAVREHRIAKKDARIASQSWASTLLRSRPRLSPMRRITRFAEDPAATPDKTDPGEASVSDSDDGRPTESAHPHVLVESNL